MAFQNISFTCAEMVVNERNVAILKDEISRLKQGKRMLHSKTSRS